MKNLLLVATTLLGFVGSVFGQFGEATASRLTSPAFGIPSQTFVFDNILDQTNLNETVDHAVENWYYPNLQPEDWWWTFDAALGKPPQRIGFRLPPLPAEPVRVTFTWRADLYRFWRWENLADWSIPGAQLRFHWKPKFKMCWVNYGNPVETVVSNFGVLSGDDPSNYGNIWPPLGPFDGIIDGAGTSGTTYTCPGDCVTGSDMTYFRYNITTEFPVHLFSHGVKQAWQRGAVIKFDSDLMVFSGYEYSNGGPNPTQVADVPLYNTHLWATEWWAKADVNLIVTVHYQ